MFHDVERTLESLALAYPDQVDGYRRYARAALPAARLVLAAAARPPSVGGLARIAATQGRPRRRHVAALGPNERRRRAPPVLHA